MTPPSARESFGWQLSAIPPIASPPAGWTSWWTAPRCGRRNTKPRTGSPKTSEHRKRSRLPSWCSSGPCEVTATCFIPTRIGPRKSWMLRHWQADRCVTPEDGRSSTDHPRATRPPEGDAACAHAAQAQDGILAETLSSHARGSRPDRRNLLVGLCLHGNARQKACNAPGWV